MKPRSLALVGASLLVGATLALAQPQDNPDRPPATRPAPTSDQQQQSPPSTATSKVFNGTVVAFQEGKTLKVKLTGGTTRLFHLSQATVDPSVKVGSTVRVTESRDVNGVTSLTVETPQSAGN